MRPPKVRLHSPVTAVLPVPEFWRDTVHVSGSPEHEVAVTETIATFVKVPIRPKKNPATAMAAIRVTAISIIVATTGDMAVLLSP